MSSRALTAVLLTALGYEAIRRRWWVRVHYHSLWGKTYSREFVQTRLRRLLAEFDRVMREVDLTYWVDAGTLLGAYRHRSLVPWDDDTDVCILHRDHQKLLQAAGRFRHPYRLVRISKFWSVDKIVPGLHRFWPCPTFLRLLDSETLLYTDIFQMEELPNERLRMLPLSLMHPQVDHRGQPFELPRSVVLPTQELKVDQLSVHAPAQPLVYLHRQFGPDLTPNHHWDERAQDYLPNSPGRL